MTQPLHLTDIELSVVMPVYNEGELIEPFLRFWANSLKEQNISFEFVVINDGSMDRTGRVLDILRKEMKELRVIHQLNLGHSRAIRRGYELARGKYILQLDANGRYEFEDFLMLWTEREDSKMLVAQRTHRIDNFYRRSFSHFLKTISYYLFNVTLIDPNSPLRLFSPEKHLTFLKKLPLDWESINFSLSIHAKLNSELSYSEIKIPFRKRVRGETRTTFSELFFLSLRYLREIIQLKYQIMKKEKVIDPTLVTSH